MKKYYHIIWPLVLVISAFVSIYYTLYYIARYPHRAVLQLGGDGLKNYYSYIYHATYGSGWWFTGMNYPYGEHLMYTDGQPALTIPLTWLRSYINMTPASLNLILNGSILLSLFLAIVYVYKLLVKFKVSRPWSVLFSICICFVSVQNFRLFGGYGLYYPFITPITFYWFLCYHQSKERKYILYLILLSWVITFLHPYQFALILIWALFYSIGYMILQREYLGKKLRHLIPVLLLIIIPTLIFKITQAVTDPIKDRTEYPHGLLSYCTKLTDIYSSYYSPYFIYLQEKGYINEIPAETHGYAYTGLAAIIIAIVSLIFFLIKRIRGKGKRIKEYPEEFSPIWIFIAMASLLFSMGVPFIWNMEWLYDHITSFRQFRALGWFALLFYYIITIYSVVVLYRAYQNARKNNRKIISALLFLLPAAVWVGEAYGYTQRLRVHCLPVNYNHDFFYSLLDNEKDWKTLLKERNYKSSDFQAILHMPYQHVGSEKVWLANANWSLCLSFKAAYQLHLPTVDANMSRSSWGVTFKQVKIDGGPYTYKSLLYEVIDKRPYLLMRSDYEHLTPDEQYLFNNADSIGSTSGMFAYALYPEKLLQRDSSEKAYVKSVAAGLLQQDSSINRLPYHYEHYETNGNTRKIWGNGAALPVTFIDTVFTTIDINTWPKDTLYECSAWFLGNDKNFRNPYADIVLLDSSGATVGNDFMNGDHSNDNWGNWFRLFKFIHIPGNCTNVQIILRKRSEDSYYSMDELLLRRADDIIVSKDAQGVIMANNHIIYSR